jgi:arginase
MSDATLIQVPYHLGRKGVVLGAGPEPLALAIGGESIVVERSEPLTNEISATFDVIRQTRTAVRETLDAGRFPLVLAGNCHCAVAAVAALERDLGIVWFDAHADFHTPDSTTTGFFDGMPLALITGEGWAELRGTIEGLRPVPEDRIVLVGARDLEPTEEARLAASRIAQPDAGSLEAALDDLRTRTDAVYLHIDLDVLDPSEGKANGWAVEGGLTADELEAAVEAVRARFDIAAATFSAYDPTVDPEGRIPAVAARLAALLTAEKVAS